MKIPTIKEVEKKIGSTKNWSGNCYSVSCAVVKAGLVEGTAVYGHFLGKVSDKQSHFHPQMPFQRHGWVVLEDGRIMDLTRWVFEAVDPYVHVCPGDSNEYDEGGNSLRGAMRGPPPQWDSDEKQFKVTKGVMATAPWVHVEKLLRIDISVQEPGTLSEDQLHWLANAPFHLLQPNAEAIYEGIKKLGEEARIPYDNRKMAKRIAEEFTRLPVPVPVQRTASGFGSHRRSR